MARMRWVAILGLGLSACAPSEALRGAGLEYGRQYLWVKEGATELDRAKTMTVCADRNQRQLVEAMKLNSIPVVGLIALPASVPVMTRSQNERVQCMEHDGWRLVDVRTGRRQIVDHDRNWTTGIIGEESAAPQ